MMRKLLLGPIAVFVLVGLFVGLGTAFSQDAASELHRERIEWCDIWFTDAEKDAAPRVLLMGDSITRGYFGAVEKALGGRAYCGRLTTSRSVCDPVLFQELGLVLGQYEFAVVHFNNGLHGWGYSEEEYAAGFERLLDAFKEQAPKAQLVWASTTPLREDSSSKEKRERVARRNAIAAAAVDERGIPTNDLHALVTAHPEFFGGDGVHFSNAGREAQGSQVAAAILEYLP